MPSTAGGASASAPTPSSPPVQDTGPYQVTVLEPCAPCDESGELWIQDEPELCSRETCERCAGEGARVVSRRAFVTLDGVRDHVYEIARPMMCDGCEAPGAPWRIVPSYGATSAEPVTCTCAGGPVDPVPAGDSEETRALFSLPAEGAELTLPDGTVIEVERGAWHTLARVSGDAALLKRALELGDRIVIEVEAVSLEELDRRLTSLMAAQGKVWTGSIGRVVAGFNASQENGR